MQANPDRRLAARSRMISAIIGLGVCGLGLLVLVGWALDIPTLKGAIPSIGTTMKPNTALGFVLGGASLWLSQEGQGGRSRHWAMGMALVVLLLGGFTLAEYLFGLNLRIDQLLFADPAGVGSSMPGRMSPAAAFAFLSAGSSLALLDVAVFGGRWPAQIFACLTWGVAFTSFAGYIYRAEYLFGAENYLQIAIHTTMGFLALATGLLLSRPESNIMSVTISESAAGRLFRRMAPAVFLVPLALGWLRMEGQGRGMYNTRTGLALMVLGTTILLFGLLWGSAVKILGMEVERQEARQALASSEEKAQVLLEMAGCGMGLVDFEGRIRDVNRRWEVIFGLDRKEILGRTAFEFMAPKDRPYLETRFRKLAADEQLPATEWEIMRPGGGAVMVESYPAKVEIGGEPFIIVAINDVTERTRMRRQAALNEKLATVGTLATGIVHEINNPTATAMASLEVMAGLLKQECANISQADVSRLATLTDRALQSVFRIREIVGSIKGFARMGAEDLTPSDVHALLDGALVMTAHETNHKIQIVKEYAPDLPRVPANGGRLEQLFVNLIVNAAQAMGEQAAQNRIVIRTRPEEDHIRVEVEDSGMGIPHDVLSKIFDPFFTTKPEGVGTGIGLSICHDIVHQHGGEITVTSEVGKGTRFSLTLSRFTGVERIAERRALNPALPRLLLVDDDPLVLAALQRNLWRSFHIVTAQGGRAAMDILEREKLHAIATDLNMPDVNGVDLYRHVAEAFPALKHRVVFFSGSDPSPEFSDFLVATGLSCLIKPFATAELEKALGNLPTEGAGF